MIGDPSGRSTERNLLDRDDARPQRRGAAWPAGAVPRLLARRRRGAHGQQPRLARRAVADRVPAGHRQALHDPVHARQGLRADPPGTRPVVHGVLVHAPAVVRLLASPPHAGRRAADGRRRPVGQHHRRPGAHPPHFRAGGGRGRRGAARPRPRLQAVAVAVGHEVRQVRDRRHRSGWTRRGRRRSRSTSTGCNTDDRDVGTYLRWFTELPRDTDRGARCGGRRASRTPGRPSGRWRSTSRPGRTGRRPRPRRSGMRPPSSRGTRSPIRRSWPRSMRRPAGSRSIPVATAVSRRSWRTPA